MKMSEQSFSRTQTPRSSSRDRNPPKCDYDTPIFLRILYKHPILWDYERPDYKDTARKELVWEKIAKRFYDMTGPQLQAKLAGLKNARSNFLRRKAKRNPSGSAASSRGQEQFKHEAQMSFLYARPNDETADSNIKADDGDASSFYDESTVLENSMDVRVNLHDAGKFSDVKASFTLSPNTPKSRRTKFGKPQAATINLTISPVLETGRNKKRKSTENKAPKITSTTIKRPKTTVIKGKPNKPFLSPVKEEDEDYDDEKNMNQSYGSEDGINEQPNWLKKKIADARIREGKKENQRKTISDRVEQFIEQEEESKKMHKEERGADKQQPDLMSQLSLALLSEFKKEEDVYSLFCQSVAPRLKMLPKSQSRRVMKTILDEVNKAEEQAEQADGQSHSKTKDQSRSTARSKQGTEVPTDMIVVVGFNCQVTIHDLLTLQPLTWVNDKIINFYLKLIMDTFMDVYCFNTFFLKSMESHGFETVKDWTKGDDIFNFRLILIPVFGHDHWSLLACDMEEKTVSYYNSTKSGPPKSMDYVLEYLEAEYEDKKKGDGYFHVQEWTKIHEEDIPRQDNGVDCGVFLMRFAYCLAMQNPFNFTQEDMPRFRTEIHTQIVSRNLLP